MGLLKRWLLILLFTKKALVGLFIIIFFVLIAVLAPYLALYDPTSTEFVPWLSASKTHPFGTTDLGQDLFSQFIWGTRVSLIIGFSVGILSQCISVLVGVVGGYYRGRIGRGLDMLTNVFLCLPAFPLMVVLAAFLQARGTWTIVLVLSIGSWAWGARVFRSQTLSLREREFISAAKVVGESNFRIIFFELLPNMFPLIMAQVIGTAQYAVFTEAGLRFIGIGSVDEVTWGTMLYWASNSFALAMDAWWWILPPGLAIGILGLGLVLLNFFFDKISNPRLQEP